MEQKESFYNKFWVVWLGVTVLYLALFFLTLGNTAVNQVAFLVGMFVPFGFFNGVGLVTKLSNFELVGFVALTLLVLSLIFADKLAKRLTLQKFLPRFAFNLALLFLLTLCVDLLFWGGWQSLAALEHNAF